jgi:hypothetical protein
MRGAYQTSRTRGKRGIGGVAGIRRERTRWRPSGFFEHSLMYKNQAAPDGLDFFILELTRRPGWLLLHHL